MSAGKSTLLNALIGRRFLPSKNEACTAAVCRVTDVDERNVFRGRCKSNSKWQDWVDPVDTPTIERWNSSVAEEIELEGNLPNIANTKDSYRVVLIDTPGPNNASCAEHARITEQIIADADFSAIVFVINASVAGVEDEWKLLNRLQRSFTESQKKSRIVFVLNKIDLLDSEIGESSFDVVSRCSEYLSGLGFVNPVVIPLCSELAVGIRQLKSEIVPYRVDKGKPKLKSRQKRGVYESVERPRLQMKLRNQIEQFLAQRTFYRSGLRYSGEADKCLMKLDHRRKHKSQASAKVLLGGKFFRMADLDSAEKLTGVPVLELLLENDLVRFSNKEKGLV